MSGIFDLIGSFIAAIGEVFWAGGDEQGIAPQGIAPQGIAPQGIAPQGIAPQGIAPQGIAPQGIAPQQAAQQPIPNPPTLAERLQEQRNAIAAVRQTLGNTVWNLGDTPAVTDLFENLDSFITRGRQVQIVQDDVGADHQLTILAGQVAALGASINRAGPALPEVQALYANHGVVPGVPLAAATIWAPLLGVAPPNDATLAANLTAAKIAFAAALPAGFDALPDDAKAARFVDMWKLRAVSTVPAKGVSEIYVSSFDGPADRFGVSWNLTGLDGWVLHGHGMITWNDSESEVAQLDLPRLHIKPLEGAGGQGGTIEITDNTVIAQLCRSSFVHVSRMAKNRVYAEIFARTKFKRR